MGENTNQRLERLRHDTLLLLGLGIAGAVLGAFDFGLRLVPLGFLPLAAGIVAVIAGGVKYNKYAYEYKRGIVEGALRSVFDDLTFEPGRGFPRDFLDDTGMVDMGNRYQSDDYISGSYKGVPFERADVDIKRVTSTGKTTTVVTLFEGPWTIFDFNKPFLSDLQVAQKGFGGNRSNTGFFGLGGTMNKIATESIPFNDRFNVYAENDHEAFYLLTPPMMEEILRLSEGTRGKLMLCFLDSRLHVAVNSGENAFEPSLFRPIGGDEGILDEIRHITSFVTRLNLDRDLFNTR